MIKVFVQCVAAAATYAALAAPAHAQSYDGWRAWWREWIATWSEGRGGTGGTVPASSAVPEIDASTGLLTLAAVGAALALAWEIKRRRKAA